MKCYASLLLALLFAPQLAAAAEVDSSPPSDSFATARYVRALEQARHAAQDGPLAIAAVTAVTAAASSVTATSARLNGTINAGGSALPVNSYFNYGLSAGALGTSTPGQFVTGNQDTPISRDLSNLACGTQYFFAAVAKDPTTKTEIVGSVLNFTTAPCAAAPTVTTSAASAVTAGGATLNGNVNPNGSATTAAFDYGTTASLGLTASVGPIGSGNSGVPISAGLTQLTCATQYFFRARASNSGGDNEGTTLNFTTSACPLNAPVVTTTAATSITGATATLNATVNPKGLATTAKFDFGTAADSLTREAVVGSVGSGSSAVPASAPITQLTCGTQYFYRASATNSGGTASGAVLSFQTTACVEPAPVVTTTAATGITPTTATLNGTVDPNGVATTARFQWGLSAGALNTNVDLGDVGSGNSPVPISTELTNLTCNTTYFYRARATSAGGSPNGDTLSFTTSNCSALPPTVATSAATAISTSGATLNGSVNPKGLATAAAFQYGLAANDLSSSVFAGSVGSGNSSVPIQAAVGQLLCNKQYFFRAVASSAGGLVNGSTLSFTTSACPAPAPVAVSSAATGIGPTGATLNGTVDPNGSPTIVYFDFGTTTAFGTSTAYAQLTGDGALPVSLATGRLQCETTYYFRVRAVSVGGESTGATLSFASGPCGGLCQIDYGISCTSGDFWNNANFGSTNVVTDYTCGTVQPGNETGPEYTYYFYSPDTVQATVNLTGLAADLDLFVIDSSRNTCTGTNCVVSSSIGGTTAEAATFTAVGGNFYYVVVDGYAGNTSNYSINVACSMPPSKPTVVVGAATRVTLGEATIQGTVNPQNSSTTIYLDYGLSSGQLDRSVRYGTTFTGVAPIGVYFELSGLVCGNTYFYQLRAENAAGTKTTNPVSFTTAACGTPVCKADFPLNCGGGDSWNNGFGGSTNNIESYTCTSPFSGTFGNATGPEYTYFFTPAQTVEATVNLTGLSSDIDLYSLRTPGGVCTGGNCISFSRAGGTSNESIVFIANQNQTYDINVDGYVGNTSNYSINMSCIVVPIFNSSFE